MTQVPMLDLRREYEYMKSDIDNAIEKCLGHQRWILGPEVKELEDAVAGYLGAEHCIGVSSGTDALVLALRAAAIERTGREFFDSRDEIITTPFTFTATGDAILRSGATPVFVDIDPVSFNIDPARIQDCVDKCSNVVGILPVHLYGQPCNMDEIMKIAEANNLFVVEDVAQAIGASWAGKKTGTIGTAGTFSFFPSKNLGGFGDGGMIATGDDGVADIARMLMKHGGRDKYNVDHVGYNARLDTIQAAVLLAKLKHLDEFNEKRRVIAGRYVEGLSGIDGLQLPAAGEGVPEGHAFHQFTIRVAGGRRDELQKHLGNNGVSSMLYYPISLHEMKVFGDGRSKSWGELRESERATQEVLSLPVEPLQSDESTDYVVDQVRRFMQNAVV
jgi:dTDP-4-amino-4,6-dideoxygalactose transaminase